MSKHISFFLKIKYFFKGFTNCDINLYEASDEIKSHITVFKKERKGHDYYTVRYIVYFDQTIIFDKTRSQIINVNDETLIAMSINDEGKEVVDFIYLNDESNATISITAAKGESFSSVFDGNSSKYFIYKDDNTKKYSIIDYLGKIHYSMIDKYTLISLKKWNAITFKIGDQVYLASKDFEKVRSFDYITKFGELSQVYIGIRYDKDEERKYYYFMPSDKDIDTEISYLNIMPGERNFISRNSDIYEVPKIVKHYVCKVKPKEVIILDDNGNRLYKGFSFFDVYPFAYGTAFANSNNRGIVLLRADGSAMETYIKKINFIFRKVKYGLYEEVFAGVETFDEECYVDRLGNLHKIYNKNRYNSYIYDEELADEKEY